MKNTSSIHQIVLLFLFSVFYTNSYSQDVLWEKSFGGKQAEYLFDAQPTADYGFILAGSSLSNKTGNKTGDNHGDLDYWVWKMDEKGDIDWQKNIGGSGFDLLQSIKNTNDGGFILAGTSNSPNDFQKKHPCKGLTDYWIIKLDVKGNEQWQRTIGGSGQDEVLCAFQTKDGGYILGGSSSSSPKEIQNNDSDVKDTQEKFDLYVKTEKCSGNMDYWIIKLDNNGIIQWQKTYGGIYADVLRSMEQTKDGGYILGGYSNSPISGEKSEDNIGIGDYWIIKTDNLGTIKWQKTYGGNGDNQLNVIHQTYDGNFIAGGNSNSQDQLTVKGGTVSVGTDYWILKMDEKGEVIWTQTYDFGKVDILTSLIENNDHTLLIGGYAQSENKNPYLKTIQKDKIGVNDYIALKINEKGEILWNNIVGSSGEDILRKLIETRDGGYLLAGTSNSKSSRDKETNIGYNDFWVVKLLDKSKPKVEKKPVEAIPNPATDFTNIIIGYDFKNGTAILSDIAGQILQSFKITGRTIPIDLQGLPEGIYIVNIRTDIQNNGVKIIKTINRK
jgi:hypothetical protein